MKSTFFKVFNITDILTSCNTRIIQIFPVKIQSLLFGR